MKLAQNNHPTLLFGPSCLFGTWEYVRYTVFLKYSYFNCSIFCRNYAQNARLTFVGPASAEQRLAVNNNSMSVRRQVLILVLASDAKFCFPILQLEQISWNLELKWVSPFIFVTLQGHRTQIDTFQTNNLSWLNDTLIRRKLFLVSWGAEIQASSIKFDSSTPLGLYDPVVSFIACRYMASKIR